MTHYDETDELLERPTCADPSPLCGCADCRIHKSLQGDPIRRVFGPFGDTELWYTRGLFSFEDLHTNGLIFVVQRGPEQPAVVAWLEEQRALDRAAPRPGIRPEPTLEEAMDSIDTTWESGNGTRSSDAAGETTLALPSRQAVPLLPAPAPV